MYILLTIALAIAGVTLPSDINEFVVGTSGRPPMILKRTEDGNVWLTHIVDRKNQRYIDGGLFHINGLAIGHNSGDGYNYQDITELLPVQALHELESRDSFTVQGGTVHIQRKDQNIEVDYSPTDITEPSLTVTVIWRTPPK